MFHNELTYGIIQLLNGILIFSVGLFVISRNPRNPIYQTFAVFCLSLCYWMFSYYLWILNNKNPFLSGLFFKLLMLGAVFMHTTYFHFVLCLTNRIKRFLNLLIIGYILSLFFTFLILANKLYDNYYHPKLFFTYWPDANIFTSFLILVELFYLLFPLTIIADEIIKSKRPENKKYVVWLIMTIVSFSGGLTNWFLWYNIPIPPIGNPLVTLYPLVVIFLILKYQLLDIQIVIRKSLIYSLLVTIITVLYFLVVSFFENIFRGFVGYKSIPLTIAMITLFAFVFQPLKNIIQTFVDRYFFKASIEDIQKENTRLLEELQRSEKMRAVGTLAAGLAHEIKNPLTSIKTFTEFLDSKYQDREFREKFKRIVGAEVERINKIVHQLLDFAKPNPPTLNNVDACMIIDDLLNLLSNELINKRINILKKYENNTMIICADINQLRQAFLNIFINAIDAMKNGGILTIGLAHRGARISLTITDTGMGISKKDLPSIFDPFYSTKDTGSGLGLSIVHNIIKAHDGIINVKSEIGKGTTFEILI